MQDPNLWARLRTCHPDEVEAEFPFSKRLARDNGWNPAYAKRVVTEYLRFAYLSRVAAGMVTPSDEVDQAWHLHLTYTKHYWGAFKTALGGPLHHMPTKGGPDQAVAFRKAYAETLDHYRAEFGEPPSDIWPPEDIRFGKAPHFRRINTQDAWVIRKPRWMTAVRTKAIWAFPRPGRISGAVLSLSAVLLGTGLAFAHGRPAGDTLLEQARNMVWHWAIEHTLWFAAGVVAVIVVLAVLLQKSTKGSGCGTSGCGTGGGDGGGSGCGGCGS